MVEGTVVIDVLRPSQQMLLSRQKRDVVGFSRLARFDPKSERNASEIGKHVAVVEPFAPRLALPPSNELDRKSAWQTIGHLRCFLLEVTQAQQAVGAMDAHQVGCAATHLQHIQEGFKNFSVPVVLWAEIRIDDVKDSTVGQHRPKGRGECCGRSRERRARWEMPSGLAGTEVLSQENSLMRAGIGGREYRSVRTPIELALGVFEPVENSVVKGIASTAFVLGEESKELLDPLHVCWRERKAERCIVDGSFPLAENRKLQQRTRRPEAELVVNEAKLLTLAPGRDQLGLEREGMDHSSSSMRSAKNPLGQRSLNSPCSSTRSRRIRTPSR